MPATPPPGDAPDDDPDGTPPPVPVRPDGGRVRTDVLVVGGGVAGLYAATCLPAGLDVVIVDKGTPGRSGSSPWAQGGMAAAVGDGDTPARHAADTIAAGDGACDRSAVAVLTRETPEHVDALLGMGARLDADGQGPVGDRSRLRLAREGGHSVPRSVHTADATGAELVRVLRRAAAPRVRRLEGLAVHLATTPSGRVVGAWILHEGDLVGVSSRAVLLATGGCGGLFAATTNPDSSTADGVALAVGAGAAVRDLEYVQFHPTGLAVEGARRLLLTEALRGAGATLHDDDGERFMPAVHPDAELAPRHVVTTAMVARRGGIWLDTTGIDRDRLREEFPTALEGGREHGLDLATERVPVSPAAHYMVGGVRTDLQGHTSRPGLHAAGEVASTGIHGANRLAGNSLAEAMVFGARTAAAVEHGLTDRRPLGDPPTLGAPRDEDPAAVRDELRALMWEHVGPLRSAEGLARARDALADLARRLGPVSGYRPHAELTLAVTAARLLVASAAARPESRGGHQRSDHPGSDPAWAGVHLEHTAPLPW